MPVVTVRKRVLVSGRVQGVWFRESCRNEADARRVGGWVRNRPDGKVEAVFEGEPDAVEALVGWCSIGPLRARVVRVEITDELPVGETRFTVR
jgi:acylphosphatase